MNNFHIIEEKTSVSKSEMEKTIDEANTLNLQAEEQFLDDEKTVKELDYKMLGKRIKKARMEKGITQEELSTKCNCSVTHLSKIENGKTKVSLDLFHDIIVILDKSFGELFMDQDKASIQYRINHELAELLSHFDQFGLNYICDVIDSFEKYLKYKDDSDT